MKTMKQLVITCIKYFVALLITFGRNETVEQNKYMSFGGFWMALSLKFVNKVQFSPLTSEPLDDI